MEPYYNSTTYGNGLEGFLNYTNTLVDGWLVTLFLVVVWIASISALSKSEWKLSSCVGFASIVVFVLAMIFNLFVDVYTYVFVILVVLIAGSIAWSLFDR